MQQGPAQLTRRDGCDSSFDNRNGAMCSGPRVCGWTGCLPSGARANLPTVLSGFWGFSTYRLFPFSGRSPWITSPPPQHLLPTATITAHARPRHRTATVHSAPRYACYQPATRHGTGAEHQPPAAHVAVQPTRWESRAAVLSICPNTASTSVQILRARVTALPRVGCTATALGAGRTATVHHLGGR